jgi:hypothetical protein
MYILIFLNINIRFRAFFVWNNIWNNFRKGIIWSWELFLQQIGFGVSKLKKLSYVKEFLSWNRSYWVSKLRILYGKKM